MIIGYPGYPIGYPSITLLQIVQDTGSHLLNLDPAKMVPSARFFEDLKVDSLDVIELVMNLEIKFEVEKSDEIVGDITKVQDVLDYLKSNQKRYKVLPDVFPTYF